MLISMKIALLNPFLIQKKILKTNGVMSIFKGVRCVKFNIFLISLLIRENVTKSTKYHKRFTIAQFLMFFKPKKKFSKAITILNDVISLNLV